MPLPRKYRNRRRWVIISYTRSDEKDERQLYIIRSLRKHEGFYSSEKAFLQQYQNQEARLDRKKRWNRKNMKGYHLREVVVD